MLKHFKPSEFSDYRRMNLVFLEMLDDARSRAGVPFKLNSSFRPEDPGSHGKGLAVDIACVDSRARFLTVLALLSVGFRRIGVYERHVHVDFDLDRDQDVLWLGHYQEEVHREAEADVS